MCVSNKQYDQALEHFHNALEIQKDFYLSNHPSLAITFNSIATIHFKQNSFEQSLTFHLKALENQLNSLSNDHSDIAQTYFQISKNYFQLKYWSEALDYAFKALEQLNKSVQVDTDQLIAFNNHIAQIYNRREEHEKALKYYHEVLDIWAWATDLIPQQILACLALIAHRRSVNFLPLVVHIYITNNLSLFESYIVQERRTIKFDFIIIALKVFYIQLNRIR